MEICVEKLFKEVNICYRSGDFTQCQLHLEKLYKKILKNFQQKPQVISTEFYDNIISNIIKQEIGVAKNGVSKHPNFKLLSAAVNCVWSTFYDAEDNQNKVGLKSEYMQVFVDLWSEVYHIFDLAEEQNSDYLMNVRCVIKSCLILFSNIMTSNANLRPIMFGYLQTHIKNMVAKLPAEEALLGSMILHHFLLNSEIKHNILSYSSNEASELLMKLIKLCSHDSETSCFALFCSEILISNFKMFNDLWKRTSSTEDKFIILDVFKKSLTEGLANIEILKAIVQEFKRYGDEMLHMNEAVELSYDPGVATQLLNVISIGVSSNLYAAEIQEDRSLLITVIYLLRCMTDIRNKSQVPDDTPIFGFKCDLVQIIGSMACKNEQNQDIIRENNGILLLLENSQYDMNNPVIKECVIVAMKFILENNYENQAFMASVKATGVAPNKTMDELGFQMKLVDGKPLVSQINK